MKAKRLFGCLISLICLAGAALASDGIPSDTPAEVRAFMLEYQKSVESQNIAGMAKHFSREYRRDGRNYQQQVEWLGTWVPYNTQYRYDFERFEQTSSISARLYGYIHTDFGASDYSYGKPIIKEDGRWKWVGTAKE